MKTKQLLAILRGHVEPVLVSAGFSRLKDRTGTCAAWCRSVADDCHFTVWAQNDKWPFDPWVGSRFLVELQRAPVCAVGATHGALRLRLQLLLTDAEREEVRTLQNAVIAKCRIPTEEEHRQIMGFGLLPGNEYEASCRLIEGDFDPRLDLWLRYLDEADCHGWGEFLESWLPKALDRFASLGALSGLYPPGETLPRWRS